MLPSLHPKCSKFIFIAYKFIAYILTIVIISCIIANTFLFEVSISPLMNPYHVSIRNFVRLQVSLSPKYDWNMTGIDIIFCEQNISCYSGCIVECMVKIYYKK